MTLYPPNFLLHLSKFCFHIYRNPAVDQVSQVVFYRCIMNVYTIKYCAARNLANNGGNRISIYKVKKDNTLNMLLFAR